MTALDSEELFPTHGPLDEERQIGRTDTIVALAGRLRERGDALLLEPRRVGKTSVVRAALARVRLQSQGVTAEVNLTAANVTDGPSLARSLLQTLHDEGGEISRVLRAQAAIAHQTGRRSRLRGMSRAVEELGVDGAGDVAGLLDLLKIDAPSLDTVLAEIARAAEVRPVVVFLDEIQELRRWPDAMAVQECLARFMRTEGRRAAMVAAGSDRTATAEVFASGNPLHWNFDAFPLPPIERLAWHRGLVERFGSAGYAIESGHVDKLLHATEGHPLRTMSVAKEALREARQANASEITWGAVDAAVQTASAHPSWRT